MIKTRDFFLLDPDNEQFAVGASHKLSAGGQGCVFFFMGMFVLAGLLITSVVTRQWTHYAEHDLTIATIKPGLFSELLAMTGFCLVWNGFVLLAARLLVREVLKRRKLAREGQQIAGEAAHCSGLQNSDGDFVLEIEFGFRSPQTGAWIEGKYLQIRQDLKDKLLPPPGTPLCVLYLDDETYLPL